MLRDSHFCEKQTVDISSVIKSLFHLQNTTILKPFPDMPNNVLETGLISKYSG